MKFSFLPILLALVVIGCGGGSPAPGSSSGGGSSGSGGDSGGFTGGSNAADAFVGTWTGAWHETNGPERSGTMTIAVARATPTDAVRITGVAHNAAGGDGTVSGSVGDTHGNWGLAFDFGASGGAYSGTPTLDSRGHIVGPLYTAPSDGGFSLNIDFDLAPTR